MAAFVSRPPLTPGSFEHTINPADIHRGGVRGPRMRITQEEPLGEIVSEVPGAINNFTSLHSRLNKTSYCQLVSDKLHNVQTKHCTEEGWRNPFTGQWKRACELPFNIHTLFNLFQGSLRHMCTKRIPNLIEYPVLVAFSVTVVRKKWFFLLFNSGIWKC